MFASIGDKMRVDACTQLPVIMPLEQRINPHLVAFVNEEIDNRDAFNKFLANYNNFKTYVGCYVGFHKGKFVAYSVDKEDIIEKMNKTCREGLFWNYFYIDVPLKYSYDSKDFKSSKKK